MAAEELDQLQVATATLKLMHVHLTRILHERELDAFASSIKGEARATLLEDYAQRIAHEFQAFVLAGDPQQVFYYDEGQAKFSTPFTWWDHLKQDVGLWFCCRRLDRLGNWFLRRVGMEDHYQTVVCQGHVEAQRNWCPHLAVRQPKDATVHFAWAAGFPEAGEDLRIPIPDRRDPADFLPEGG